MLAQALQPMVHKRHWMRGGLERLEQGGGRGAIF